MERESWGRAHDKSTVSDLILRKEKKSVMQRSHYKLAFSSFELSYKSDGVRKKQEIEVETGEERDRQRQTDRI